MACPNRLAAANMPSKPKDSIFIEILQMFEPTIGAPIVRDGNGVCNCADSRRTTSTIACRQR